MQNLDLSHVKLKCEKLDSQAKRSNVTIYNDTGSAGEWSDLFKRYKNLGLFQAESCVNMDLHAMTNAIPRQKENTGQDDRDK